jgi:hypothetical protein
MDIEPIAKPSLLVRALMRWRLITFVTLVVLVAGMLAITYTAGHTNQKACGCGPPDGYYATADHQRTMTAQAASPTPILSPTPATIAE